MKNLIPLTFLILLLTVSCNNAKLEQLKNENEDMKSQLGRQEEDLNNFMQVFNDIEENLAQGRLKEKLIVKNSGNNENGNRVEMVKNDIRAIDNLMQQNRENLKNLSDKLKSSKGENNQFKRMIENFEVMIKEKDREILVMVGQLEDLNYEVQDLYSSISDLKLKNLKQGKLIDQQKDKLNTAWYIIGTKKELKAKNIITKEGGFIGIGGVKKLNQDFEVEYFTKIDTREKSIFQINGKKVKLITPHPNHSYLIRKIEGEKNYSSFEITLPDEFWKNSKYLVLVVD